MEKLFVSLIVLVLVYVQGVVIPTTEPCVGKNKGIVNCGGCPKTCENYNKLQLCNMMCQINSCECLEGFVLHNGECIDPKECPAPVCKGKNQVFNSCGKCEGTCDNLNPICTMACALGKGECQCDVGFVLHNGECISPKECPKIECKLKNQEYRQCSGCEGTCSNPNPICTMNCGPSRCQCKTGYVMDNGQCILPKDCPPQCKGRNQQWYDCSTGCPATCENPNLACKMKCEKASCQCAPGYLLHNATCVDPKECPK